MKAYERAQGKSVPPDNQVIKHDTSPSRWGTAGTSFPVLYVERVFLTLSSSNAFKAVRAQKLLLPSVGGRQMLKAAADHGDKMGIHYPRSCVLVSMVQTHRYNLNSEIKISTQEPDNKLNYSMKQERNKAKHKLSIQPASWSGFQCSQAFTKMNSYHFSNYYINDSWCQFICKLIT